MVPWFYIVIGISRIVKGKRPRFRERPLCFPFLPAAWTPAPAAERRSATGPTEAGPGQGSGSLASTLRRQHGAGAGAVIRHTAAKAAALRFRGVKGHVDRRRLPLRPGSARWTRRIPAADGGTAPPRRRGSSI